MQGWLTCDPGDKSSANDKFRIEELRECTSPSTPNNMTFKSRFLWTSTTPGEQSNVCDLLPTCFLACVVPEEVADTGSANEEAESDLFNAPKHRNQRTCREKGDRP